MVKLRRLWASPWLCLPAPFAHDISQIFLTLRGHFSKYIGGPKTFFWCERSWRGLHFSNPLGIAGGVDKNAEHLDAWWSYGAGFVEVGTVTPEPQAANPGKILRRNNNDFSVWNKMGFPNQGGEVILSRLSSYKSRQTPIFVNIGKNRTTSNEKAVTDYVTLINKFETAADAFVINISSPNTTGLRDLLIPEALMPFLTTLRAATRKPQLLKLSPDLKDDEFTSALDISLKSGIDGWVISNTTTKFTPEGGGTSGLPLAERSQNLLKLAIRHLGPRRGDRLLVSVGGLLTANDIKERLALGADLVQVYAALIFSGPNFFQHVAIELQ